MPFDDLDDGPIPEEKSRSVRIPRWMLERIPTVCLGCGDAQSIWRRPVTLVSIDRDGPILLAVATVGCLVACCFGSPLPVLKVALPVLGALTTFARAAAERLEVSVPLCHHDGSRWERHTLRSRRAGIAMVASVVLALVSLVGEHDRAAFAFGLGAAVASVMVAFEVSKKYEAGPLLLSSSDDEVKLEVPSLAVATRVREAVRSRCELEGRPMR